MNANCANCGNNAINGPFNISKDGELVYANAYLCDVSYEEMDCDGYDVAPIAS